jgi:Ca2+-binding RTX toxin-like protein
MKKILTLLLMGIAVQLFAQQQQNYLITGISLIVPATLDANIANWGTGTSFITISATTKLDPRGEIPAAVRESKILVTIKSGDSKVVRGIYTNANAPASNFTKNPMRWSGIDAVSLLGDNRPLDPGSYSFCVHFFQPVKPGNTPQECSLEVCRPFSVRAVDQQTYQPPQAISPADGTVINEADVKKPVTFRWTPVVPKPREAVTYKLRVFEIRQGQTATTAVKSGNPLLEKEVTNQTQFVLPSLSQLTIAMGSSYGWYVQATNLEGTPIGGNNGMSNIMTFGFLSKIEEDDKYCNPNSTTLNVNLESNGNLIICGTSQKDEITLCLDNTGKKIEVDNLLNGAGKDYAYDFSMVNKIIVSLGDDDDKIIFNDSNGNIGLLKPLKVDVGEGNNIVFGCTGKLSSDDISKLDEKIIRLKKIQEEFKILKEDALKLNRKAAEIAAFKSNMLLNEIKRFNTYAPNEIDSIVKIYQSKADQLAAFEKDNNLIFQMEKEFLKMMEQNQNYIKNLEKNEFIKSEQLMQKFAEQSDIEKIDETKSKELAQNVETILQRLATDLGNNKFPNLNQMSQIDSLKKQLLIEVNSIRSSLHVLSKSSFVEFNEKDSLNVCNDTFILGKYKFTLSDQNLQNEISRIHNDFQTISDRSDSLLVQIDNEIGKLFIANAVQEELLNCSCSFTTNNVIIGSGIIIGTNGNDLILAQPGNNLEFNFILGAGGNDRINGAVISDFILGDLPFTGVSDEINGGGGVDLIFGNDGNDCLNGGDDIDIMFGNKGDDCLHGNKGRPVSFTLGSTNIEIEIGDLMFGNQGKDEMYGDESIDILFGNSGNDTMYGNDGSDLMFGNKDDDYMWGGNGGGIIINGQTLPLGNLMFGNSGNDHMYGGINIDLMWGNSGNDEMKGDEATDLMYGNQGQDVMSGDQGFDMMWGNRGDDVMNGNDGIDLLFGNRDNDIINGNNDPDIIFGNRGNDQIHGNNSPDFIFGNRGDDIIYGDNGLDILHGNRNMDKIYGGDGIDFIWGNKDKDELFGEDGIDIIWGNRGDDIISGGNGLDVLFGNRGNDILKGNDGMDLMCGNQGDDILNGENGVDIMFGNRGNDEIHGGNNLDLIWGNRGDDNIFGEENTDFIWGNRGQDILSGGSGIDFVSGNRDNDNISGNDGMDLLLGDKGDDTMSGGDGVDIMLGGNDKDKMHGNNDIDVMLGWNGDDCMWGDDGSDIMLGNLGNDYIKGGDKMDFLFGGNVINFLLGTDGDDEMYGEDGWDIINGNEGNDALDGGDGCDYINGSSLFNSGGNDIGYNDIGYGGNGIDLRANVEDWHQGGSYLSVNSSCEPIILPNCCGTWTEGHFTLNWIDPNGPHQLGFKCNSSYISTLPPVCVNQPISVTNISGFTCNPLSCSLYYTIQVIGPDGNPLPVYGVSFTPTGPGEYIIIIIPHCQDNICPECVSIFII